MLGPVAFNLPVKSFKNILPYLVNFWSVSRLQIAHEVQPGPIPIYLIPWDMDKRMHKGTLDVLTQRVCACGAVGKEAEAAGRAVSAPG